jgi:subtilisin family serine protease
VSPAAAVPVDPAPSAAPVDGTDLPEVTDRMIVKYETPVAQGEKDRVLEEAADAADVPEAADAVEIKTTVDGADVVELTGEISTGDAEKLAEEIAADPAVAYAEPDRLVFTAEISTDPDLDRLGSSAAAAYDADYGHQWGMQALGTPAAWDTATGRGVTIGVVDTGMAYHPDLSPKIVGGYDFVSDPTISNDGNGRDPDATDPGTYSSAGQCWSGSAAMNSNWHGTHVAGIAAAARNSIGTVGVAPDAWLLNARALGACGTGYVSDVAAAVVWLAGGAVAGVPAAPRRADVINMSLAFGGSCGPTFQSAVDTAYGRNIPVVVAAGNSGLNAYGYAPGNCYNVITTGAITSAGARASYSNWGAGVDIWAPGDGILSSGNSGAKGPSVANSTWLSGTSMAAPHVAGTVALMKQKNRHFTADQYKQLLLDSGDPFTEGKKLNTHDGLYITSVFKDVFWGAQFYDEIAWAHRRGISTGWVAANGARTYRPVQAINRDAMAAFLYRMAGSPTYTPPKVSPFKDVSTTQMYYKEMAWLRSEGISTGWRDGTYRPFEPIERDAMAAFLYRMAGSPPYSAPAVSPFKDVARGTQFYTEMSWLRARGISTGWTDGTYRPWQPINRDAMAAFLYRLAPLV